MTTLCRWDCLPSHWLNFDNFLRRIAECHEIARMNEDVSVRHFGVLATPTSASWLNQVEIWFGLLTRKTLRGASFASKDQLRSAIEAFVTKTNQHPKPFHWRKREVKGSQIRSTIINLCN